MIVEEQKQELHPPSIDAPDFIARLAGIYRDCEALAQCAQREISRAQQRVEALRRNGYIRLADLGAELLAVQGAIPGGFEEWFATHRAHLGFSRRTAGSCKAAARLIREHGVEKALLIALGSGDRQRPELFISLRLAVAPEEVPQSEIPSYLDRLRPAVEFYHALENRIALQA